MLIVIGKSLSSGLDELFLPLLGRRENKVDEEEKQNLYGYRAETFMLDGIIKEKIHFREGEWFVQSC